MKRLVLSLLILSLGTSAMMAQVDMDEESRASLLAKSDSLSVLGINLYNAGQYEDAIKRGTEALDIRAKILGKEHPDYALSLNNLAAYNSSLGDYEEAIKLCTEALNIRERVLGKEHPDYAASLNSLAVYNSKLGDYKEAIRLDTEALNVYEKIYGKEHLDYATSLNNLSFYYERLGDYAKAIEQGELALKIYNKLLNADDPDYATLLNNIATDYYYLGDYFRAMELGMQALDIRSRVLGTENPDYAASLSNIATLSDCLGDYSKAIELGEQALVIRSKVLGTEHPDYASSLNNVSGFYSHIGNYTKAIELGELAMEIYGKVFGTECPDYAISLSNVSSYYDDLGDYVRAVELGERALDIRSKMLGTEHPLYAITLNNVSGYYAHLGNYAKAIEQGKQALEIFRKIFGTENPYYAISLNSVALYLNYLGNHAEAIELGEQAMEITGKVFGTEHPYYATSIDNVGSYYANLGDYTKAIEQGKLALEIYRKVLGSEHPDYAASISNLAVQCFNLRNSTELNFYCQQFMSIVGQIIKKSFANLTSYSRTQFWAKYRKSYDVRLHQYAYIIPSDILFSCGYNSVLLSKGLLLNSEIEFANLIKESGDDQTIQMYGNLLNMKKRINKLQEGFSFINSTKISDLHVMVDSLSQEADKMEKELVNRSKVYGDYTDNLVITWEQVQEKLTDEDIAVEFVSFPLNADSTMYIVYTLRKDWEYPRMIPLFEEKQLKKIYSGEYYTTTDISELLWQPLEEVLEGVETVYFAPSGELYNIAIESVPDYATNGATIVSDGKTFHRLSSTRELALKKDKDIWKEAAVYGGLKYGMTAEGLTADSHNFNPNRKEDITYTNDELYNIADTLSIMRGGELAELLPGTLIEAEAIDKSLESSGVSSTLYTDSIGTEASFKNLSGKKTSIMHIGTHGFYWTEKEARNLDYKFLMNDETSGRYVEDKQLTRSGLLFAGANYVLSGNENQLPEGVDDGILTAKELTTIDLRGLDLVVLSACQTGLGEITGDGVFGLQRGFKKAGAQTIVMSLWKVNDKATELFMTKFFETIKLDKEGHPTNKHEAFLAAQRYLRDEYEIEQTRTINSNLTASQMRRLEREGKSVEAQTITEKVKPYADPKFWAAFIMLDGIN